MVLKVWDTGEWGFSEGSIWHSFKKGKEQYGLGREEDFYCFH